jgi:hypothetical protein
MTTTAERMESVLAGLRAAGDVEALEAAWPAILHTLRELEDFARKRIRPGTRQLPNTIDPRDGSVILGRVELRPNLPVTWQHFHDAVVRILAGPPFEDPRAGAKRARLEKFVTRISLFWEGWPKKPTKGHGRG